MCQSSDNRSSASPSSSISGCGCGGHHAHDGNADRVKPASHDLDFPPVPLPSPRVLELVGEDGLRRAVARMYELLRASELGQMFPDDAATFAAVVEKNADFIVEACGGAPRYSERHGHECMRTRHFPFVIDETARDVWLSCLWSALGDCEVPGVAARELWDWLEPMSIRMINRHTRRAQPERYPFEMLERSAQITLRRPATCPG